MMQATCLKRVRIIDRPMPADFGDLQPGLRHFGCDWHTLSAEPFRADLEEHHLHVPGLNATAMIPCLGVKFFLALTDTCECVSV